MRNANLAKWGWLFAATLAFALYLFTLPYPFIFDDGADILRADAVHRLWPPTWLTQSRRWLASATFAANWVLFGARPAGFRLLNIALHAANAVLLWLAAREALRSSLRDTQEAEWLATASACLWVAHPLNTTAVTYIVHRYESLAAMGLLAMLVCWQRALRSPRWAAWYAAAAAAATLAILSKEHAVVGPVILAAYDHAAIQREERATARRRGALAVVAVSAWATALLVYPRYASTPSQGVAADLSSLDYLRSEMSVLVHYVRLAFVPFPLSVSYCEWPVVHTWRDAAAATFAVVVLAAVAGACFFRFAPRAGFVGVAAALILAPTSTIIPLRGELLAERRLYLPLAGLAVLVVAAIHRAARGRVAITASACAAVTGLLSIATVARNRDFRTPVTLYSHDLVAHPNSSMLHYNLAGVLLLEQHDKLEAWNHYQRVLDLNPTFPNLDQNMGALAAELGRDEPAEHHLAAALKQPQTNPTAALNAATFLLGKGRDARALAILQAARARFPESPKVVEKMAWVLATARDESVVNGPQALEQAERAIAMNRGEPPFSQGMTLAAALAAAGRFEQAAELAASLLGQARAAGAAGWVGPLESQLAAYRANRRWLASSATVDPSR